MPAVEQRLRRVQALVDFRFAFLGAEFCFIQRRHIHVGDGALERFLAGVFHHDQRLLIAFFGAPELPEVHTGDRHIVVKTSEANVVRREVLFIDFFCFLVERQRLLRVSRGVTDRRGVEIRRAGDGVLGKAGFFKQRERFFCIFHRFGVTSGVAHEPHPFVQERQLSALVAARVRFLQPIGKVPVGGVDVLFFDILVEFCKHSVDGDLPHLRVRLIAEGTDRL